MPKQLTLKNRDREIRFFGRRMLIIVFFIIIMVLCLFARLYFLQVYQHSLYTTLSNQNQLGLIPIEPTRGLIYDRNGVLLAENIPVFSLDIIPAKVENLKKTIAELEKLFNISSQDIKDFNKALKQKRRFEPVPLKIKLTPVEVARFAVEQWRFPGVMINARLIRYYPLGDAFSHVVGYMGRINMKELAEVNAANYSASNYIGKSGIEKYFENKLHGTVGYQQVELDASGRIVRILKRTPPIPGDNIYLTIDSGLEITAENALGDEHGALVAIQPSTGQILALVSTPSFDPNLFVQGISEKIYRELQQSSERPLYNRAIRGLYPPGSTAKPYYALEGLRSGVVTPQYTIYDPGYFKYANHTYWNWNRNGFGTVNLEKAIYVSDDPYFYNLAVNLGIDRIDKVLTEFGFGQKVKIEMDEEVTGLVPSPTWKRQRLHAPWYTGDTISIGVGQGYLMVTPLQMAQAVSIIAERGKHLQPHLLLKVINSEGITAFFKPDELPSVNMPEKAWDLVISGMQQVITNGQGTGYKFGRNAPYPVAAKTGTAQVFALKNTRYNKHNLPKRLWDNSLFIAFAPVNKPQIAVAVIAEHSDIASIVARKVMDYYWQHRKLIAPELNPDARDESTANQPQMPAIQPNITMTYSFKKIEAPNHENKN